jgi:anti-anti-sigma factor
LSTNYDALGQELSEIFALKANSHDNWTNLELDLRAARLIDSMGLNLVVGLVKQVQGRGGKVKSIITSRTIHRTFLFTRLEKYMEIVLEEKTAVPA